MPPCLIVGDKDGQNRKETRREKSRDAARCRRKNESKVFDEICEFLPVPNKIVSQLDRSAVIRLLISFIKLRNTVNASGANNLQVKQEFDSLIPSDSEYVNALNGFIMVLSSECDLLYVSENVKTYLGLSNFDLIGQNLLSYVHEGDHSEVTDSFKDSSIKDSLSFLLRMRSTLTATGKNINLKSSSYKVLKCEGTLQTFGTEDSILVAYCEPIPHPANIEMILDSQTFLSQHSLDMKFTYTDESTCGLIGYEEEDLAGKSIFDLCHTADIKHLEDVTQKLFRLGQVSTDSYRFLAKYGGYHHVVTQATVINNPKNNKPSYVVCVHYIISNLIDGNVVYSVDQMNRIRPTPTGVIKEEVDIENEHVITNPTESLFSDLDTDELIHNITDATLTDDIPFDIDCLESLAENAPSIGDQYDFSTFNFADILSDDVLAEDIFNCAPSIGDPPLYSPEPSFDNDPKQDEVPQTMMETPELSFCPPFIDPGDVPSTSRIQVVKLPKDQFAMHSNLPQAIKRRHAQEKFMAANKNIKRSKLDKSALVKQQYPSLFDETMNGKTISLEEAKKYLLEEDNYNFLMSVAGENCGMAS